MPDPVSTSWLVPTAKELYTHKEDVKTLWNRLSTLLKGSHIAVTGMSGAGKTVLFDHLTGKAPKIGYRPPDRSQRAEKGKTTLTNKRIGLSVVPGQLSTPRSVELQHLFTDKPGVDGVIHVACHGYTLLRKEEADSILQQGLGTLQQFTEYQRQQEISELEEVLRYIQRSYTKQQKPKWMLVAAAKYDLYSNQVQDVSQYYSNASHSDFVSLLQKYSAQVGTNNFRWEAVPVCTYLDAFAYGSEIVKPQLTEPERDYFLTGFVKKLENYCGK